MGRGLRLEDSKDYLTVIDFIGNYKNNYLIPIALSGDKSQNKDNTRRNMKDTSYIKGISTINFEEVAKNRIFQSINNTNLTTMKILRDAYMELKNKIGRMPLLIDFIDNNSIDPVVIAEKQRNYYYFLTRVNKNVPTLSEYENCVLNFLTSEVLSGKRIHEVVLLTLLLEYESVSRDQLNKSLQIIEANNSKKVLDSMQRIFDLSFFTKVDFEKYGELPIIIEEDNYFKFNHRITKSLFNIHFFKTLFKDKVEVAKKKDIVMIKN